ncbi:LLM class flavin-dependent oxidoreductase [Nocardioides sp.]|uniref:LLM class flavin-dependent oxidoreductase n=1 Tax=Nocardioides sp. TaxID=35761 RepID=UPI0031FE5E72|nr:class flavin-dependent oxidoreductase [Nocardioides sp.]
MTREPRTPSLRRSVVFATEALEPVLELAYQAEVSGFDRVWTTEYVGRDAIARALAIAMRTSTIEVGTGVAYAFTRLPLAMAALASDVQRLSRGRFGLGITPGTKGVRRWFGAEFDPPAPKLVEYIAELRRIWATDPSYGVAPPQVYAPAFNPIMTRHAATVCDGLLLHPLAAGQTHLTERVLPAVARGSVDRTDPATLVAWQVTSIHDDEDVARERARAQLAFYFSTPSYSPVVEGTPWEAEPARIQEAFRASDGDVSWRRIGALLPDDMVDEFALAGTPSSVRERLELLEKRLLSQGVSEIGFQTVGADLSDDEAAENCGLIIETLGHRTNKETHDG